MMTNLFSSFDPSTNSFFSLNWVSLLIFFIFLTGGYFLKPYNNLLVVRLLVGTLYQEFKLIVSYNKSSVLMLSSLLMFILFNNFMGLFPYVFTATSHMSISLSMALPIWLGLMLYGWINYNKDMFAHLVPQSTPVVLMPFMVLIESISNLIRPLTLSIRLTANMIAGHLLMTLLGNQISVSSSFSLSMLLVVQLLLITLEMAVSMIQAYVFSVLMTLYVGEIGSH